MINNKVIKYEIILLIKEKSEILEFLFLKTLNKKFGIGVNIFKRDWSIPKKPNSSEKVE